MKTTSRRVAVIFLGLAFSSAARGETLDTLNEYGNAALATLPATNSAGFARGADFSGSASGAYTITAAGTDFWNTSDHGAFINDAALTQAGDFSAVVRSVSIASDPAEFLSAEWGRTGLMARKDPNNAASAAIAHIRKTGTAAGAGDTVLQWRGDDAGGTSRALNGNGNYGYHGNAADNNAMGSVRNTPIWLGLHRIGDRWFSTWAPDSGGIAGTWSEVREFPTTPDLAGQVTVGLAHQSHQAGTDGNGLAGNAHLDGGNTAAFENFEVTAFNADLGDFPLFYTCDVTFNGSEVSLTAANNETGNPTQIALDSWEVRFKGADGEVAGLTADIYVGSGNPGTIALIDDYIANNLPTGTIVIPDPNWSDPGQGLGYPAEFGVATGAFAGGEDGFIVNHTGDIFIPGRLDRADMVTNTINFKDGVDDFAYLEIDGQILIDDNNWAGVNGTRGGDPITIGSPIVGFDVSDPRFEDGEWVSFRWTTAEGGGGDGGVLYWDVLDTDGNFPTTDIEPADLNDSITEGYFRTTGPLTTAIFTGSGLPSNVVLGNLAPTDLGIEVYLDGELFKITSPLPTIATADFTGYRESIITLADVGTGGTSDVDESTINVYYTGRSYSGESGNSSGSADLVDGIITGALTISKTGTVTTITDPWGAQRPEPWGMHTYRITGTTTAATGSKPFELITTVQAWPLFEELQTPTGPPPSFIVGWDVQEFDVVPTLDALRLDGPGAFADAQFVVRSGLAATARADQPYINHSDPDTNANSGDWIPDLPILTDGPGGDDQYITYARTTVTILAGQEGDYTVRIRGDDGFGLRVGGGATFTSVAGNAVNTIDPRAPDTVFHPGNTGNSDAYAVCNFPTAGDYGVEFIAWEGNGGAYQEIAFAFGAFTGFDQTDDWQLLGDTSTFVPGNNSRWGAIPASVQPALPAAEEGWGMHLWYGAATAGGAAVNTLTDTMNFIRDTDATTSMFSSESESTETVLNHSDDGGGGGLFGGNLPFPEDPNVGGDTDRIAMVARAVIVAPVEGDYTIQVRSDDGFLLRWVDENDTFYAEDGGGDWHPNALQEIYFANGTGNSNTRGTTYLTAGEHEILFVWWEGVGGANFEVASAPGVQSGDGVAPPYELLSTATSATNLYVGGIAAAPFKITDFDRDENAEEFLIFFNSENGRNYAVDVTRDLTAGNWAEANDSVTGTGDSTSVVVTFAELRLALGLNPGDPLPADAFFRIRDAPL